MCIDVITIWIEEQHGKKKNVHRDKQVKGMEKCINQQTWRSKKQDGHIMLPCMICDMHFRLGKKNQTKKETKKIHWYFTLEKCLL
jgi:uncharacterized C2H2 Zn-finger protein